MSMTEQQQKYAEAIREWVNITDFREVGTAHTFTNAMAKIIDGVVEAIPAEKQTKNFAVAWEAYMRIIGAESRDILKAVLGDERFDQVCKHPNGGEILQKVFSRIKERYGDQVKPGMSDTIKINVDDIWATIDDDEDEYA